MTSKPRRDRMDAIHAIITHSDEGLREGATVPEFIRGLRVRLSRRNPATQKYVWGETAFVEVRTQNSLLSTRC